MTLTSQKFGIDYTCLMRLKEVSSAHQGCVNTCPWSTKAVISSTAIFVAIANNTLYGSKLYFFLLCQKSLDIKIMFHEDI